MKMLALDDNGLSNHGNLGSSLSDLPSIPTGVPQYKSATEALAHKQTIYRFSDNCRLLGSLHSDKLVDVPQHGDASS